MLRVVGILWRDGFVMISDGGGDDDDPPPSRPFLPKMKMKKKKKKKKYVYSPVVYLYGNKST